MGVRWKYFLDCQQSQKQSQGAEHCQAGFRRKEKLKKVDSVKNTERKVKPFENDVILKSYSINNMNISIGRVSNISNGM